MKLGFIGAGNMAGAIVKGVISSGFTKAQDIVIYDVSPTQIEKMQEQYPVGIATSNPELVKSCDVVILAVKPIFLKGVLQEIKPYAAGKCIISIAAGWSFAMLTEILDTASGAHVLRVMPNTPAMVGEGYTALCEETTLTKDEMAFAKAMFETLGKATVLPERLFDAVVAVSGSSPAYIYMVIEAMADAAVQLGMPRQTAIEAAAQAVLGSAKMVLETGEHPAKLKDAVCSPGGTTIDAVYALEQGGLRATIMDAMNACADKCKQMEGKK